MFARHRVPDHSSVPREIEREGQVGYPRRRLFWLALAVIALIVFAACGGGVAKNEPSTGHATSTQAAGARQVARGSDSSQKVVQRPTGPKTTAPPPQASTFDVDHDGFLTWTELRAAVKGAVPMYPWPPNYRTTPDLVLKQFASGGGDDVTTGGYENGFEHLLVGGANRCAWEKTWLDARKAGDTKAEANALHVMTDVLPGTPMFVRQPYLTAHYKEMIQKATLGDPTLVEREVRQTCQHVLLISPGTPAAAAT